MAHKNPIISTRGGFGMGFLRILNSHPGDSVIAIVKFLSRGFGFFKVLGFLSRGSGIVLNLAIFIPVIFLPGDRFFSNLGIFIAEIGDF